MPSRVRVVHGGYELKFARKLFHLTSGLIAVLYLASGISHRTITWLAGGATLGLLMLDFCRYRFAGFAAWLKRYFGGLFISRDDRGLNSSSWYALGLLVILLAFGGEGWRERLSVAIPVLYLAIGDTAASVIGALYGKRRWPLLKGTILGSLACFLVCLAINLVFFYGFDAAFLVPLLAVVLALVATLAEALPVPLDDNLLILVVSGSAFWLENLVR